MDPIKVILFTLNDDFTIFVSFNIKTIFGEVPSIEG